MPEKLDTERSKNTAPFFQYGNEGTNVDYQYEDVLVADKEGLEYLREKIDVVLAGADEVELKHENIYTDFTYVKIASRSDASDLESVNDWPLLLGCLSFLAALAAVVIAGIIQIITWLT